MSENSIDAIAALTRHFLALTTNAKTSYDLDRDELVSLALRLQAQVQAIRKDEAGNGIGPKIRDFLADHLFKALADRGITEGKILEISGAWDKSFEARAPQGFTFEYVQISPKPDDESVIVSDAINMDAIADETYVAVASVAVMEHINKPWLAAKEIQRILKIGGVSLQYAPFGFPPHGSPDDYWRYTRSAFDTIFDGLEPIHSEFMAPNRRRNVRGTNPGYKFRHTTEDDPAFIDDAFGGWRDTWFVLHVAAKTEPRVHRLRRLYTERLAVDATKAAFDCGIRGNDAYLFAAKLMEIAAVDDEGRLVAGKNLAAITDSLDALAIKEIFARKPRPHGSHHRYLLARYAELLQEGKPQ